MGIEQYLISKEEIVVNAMKILDRTGKRILLVAEKNILLASITDGDIRRWIIKNGSLEANVMEVANKKPLFIYENERIRANEVLQEKCIDAIPVLNKNNEIVDIVFSGGNSDKDDNHYNKNNENVRVVIMAGGLGTRLYPYTKILPKPLIPVGDTPIVEHIMNEFYQYGFNNFSLIVNHKKEMIKSYFSDNSYGYNIDFVDETVPMGTGGGLSLMGNKLASTFILSNCDILVRDNFNTMLEEHRARRNSITMICSVKEFMIPYGVVELDEDGKISNMKEKPSMSFLTNTGCYIVEPEVIHEIKEGEKIGFPDLIRRCSELGMRVGIYPITENSWYDMGQIDELHRMEKLFC